MAPWLINEFKISIFPLKIAKFIGSHPEDDVIFGSDPLLSNSLTSSLLPIATAELRALPAQKNNILQ